MARSSGGATSKRSADAVTIKTPTRRRVTELELHYVVEFLEVPTKYNIIMGKAAKGKGVVGGQLLTKTQEYVNSRLKDENLHDWDQTNTKTRFESYMRAYKAANAWDSSSCSGQGLTSKDIMNGIHTIAAKLDTLCFAYERMKTLFGARQNINPSHVAEVGAVASSFQESTIDDADNPESEAYWKLNNEEDAEHNTVLALQTENNEYGDVDTETVEVPDEGKKQTCSVPNNNKNKRRIPQQFPLDEKKPRKDFASVYLEGQNRLLELEERKFEFMKVEQDRQGRANFIRDLLRDGRSMHEVEQAVQLAYGMLSNSE
ncbi:hypothetical protein Ae201684P_016690 [Aphanomyces euteiches]|nr:hypothetical protein Ae201684P_016690 [Aphanomyces euteiches]